MEKAGSAVEDGDPAAARDAAARARALVDRMTLDEKLTMVHGTGGFSTTDDPPPTVGNFGYTAAIPRLGIPALVFGGAEGGICDAGVNPRSLGIAMGAGNDGLSPAPGTGIRAAEAIPTRVTAYPQAITQAATWDPELQYELNRAIAEEAVEKGVDCILLGCVAVMRSPLCGRIFESTGEDPHLAARLGVAIVRGTQSVPGLIGQTHRLAVDVQETNRGDKDPGHAVSANLDERTLREIYLVPYEASVVQGRPGSVMTSYNRINGTHASDHADLLTGVLRGEWGFDGFTVTDWGGLGSTVGAANAGLDMEQPDGKGYGDALRTALEQGTVEADVLDRMVLRILTSAARFGVLDKTKPPAEEIEARQSSTPERRALARRVAAEGAVLLKNDGDVLPITGTGRRLAVVGAAADAEAAYAYQGAGSGHVPFENTTDLLVTGRDGLTAAAQAAGHTVVYDDGLDLARAAGVAGAADVAVVFVHDPQSEGFDRPGLAMVGGRTSFFTGYHPTGGNPPDELVAAVAGSGTPTVVVIQGGAPVTMPWLDDVAAVVDLFFAGQEVGHVVGDLLLGHVNPSGKLPITFPRSEDDIPARPVLDPVLDADFEERLLVGYRWYDARGIEPLFAFGHGLSYGVSYDYRDLDVSPADVPAPPVPTLGRRLSTVSFTVANTGSREARETAQVYVGFPDEVGEPPKRLVGFSKQSVTAGGATRFSVELDERALAWWDASTHAWTVSPGDHPVWVGTSSADLRLTGSIRVAPAAPGR